METEPLLSVLLVEDHPAVARQLQELLRNHPPFRVTWVATLAAALAHLQAAAVDLVLLDLGLPDSRGLDTVARVVQHHPELPIVVLTAHDERLAGAALHAGAQDYLSKDTLDPAMLVRALRYALERKRAEVALRTRTAQLDTARIVSQEIVREMDLARLLRLIGTRAAELLRGPHAGLFLWQPDTERLVPEIWIGDEGPPADVTVRVGEGLPGLVARDRRGRIVNAYRRWEAAHPGMFLPARTEAALAEPLLYRDTLLGVLTVADSVAGRTFTDADAELLRLLADQAAIAIENARLYTATQQALSDLRQAQDELVRTETLRALGQMTAGIAHDLNNTLATILGQTELLRLHSHPPEIAERLQMVLTAASDGAQVVRRLQEFAQQRGGGPLRPCDLAHLVPEVLEITAPRWREDAHRKGVSIAAEVDLAGLPLVQGNPAEIRQVLTNLIFNAVEAMPHGGTLRFTCRVVEELQPPLQVRVPPGAVSPGAPPVEPPASWVELAVTDNGIGMTEEVRRRAFDPFFTTKGLHGTGLGLSVAYGIMERHGGQIDATSVADQGTTIRLRFRHAAPEAKPSARPAIPATVAGRRILIVDDEATVRETLAALLRASGHDIAEADGGAAALRWLETTPVDLVLTDLGMPGLTGWDVARAAKARRPPVPVVVLTGWGDHAGAQPPPDLDVDRVLVKPVHCSTLLAVITELVGPK